MVKYTVLISIFEGRLFPKRSDKFYMQCVFNDEVLTTDAIEQQSGIIRWNTELAWVLDGKVLHFLKSQRAAMKLQCFAIDESGSRQQLGYIIVELRSGNFHRQWLPLINPKYGRPEVRLSFSVTSDKHPVKSASPSISTIRETKIIETQANYSHISSKEMHIDVDEDHDILKLANEVSDLSNEPHAEEYSQTKWRQYRFNIDIRNIRDLQLKNARIYCKHSYAAFGSTSPFISHPPIEVFKNTEVQIPNGFCSYEFVMSVKQLQTYADAVPLTVELWHRDDNKKDLLLGTATIQISQVFQSRPVQQKLSKVQIYDHYVFVTRQVEDSLKKIADLRVVLALEDFGIIEEQYKTKKTVEGIQQPISPTRLQSSAPETGSVVPDVPPQTTIQNEDQTFQHRSSLQSPETESTELDASLYESVEHKVALELELWKRTEEELFKIKLRQSEAELIEKLTAKYQNEYNKRESYLQQKFQEFQEVERQMLDLVSDLESREQKLLMHQENMNLRLKDLEKREKMVEVREEKLTKKRDERAVKLESQILSLKDSNSKFLEESASKYRHISDLQAKLSLAEMDHSKNVTSFQDQIRSLEQQLQTTTIKLKNTRKSKTHYKTRWLKTVSEVIRLKQELVQRSADIRVLSNKENVPESKSPSTQKHQIHAEEIPIKLNVSHNMEDTLHINSTVQQEIATELQRLTQERDMLLSSGVYTTQDEIIVDINQRMEELRSNKINPVFTVA